MSSSHLPPVRRCFGGHLSLDIFGSENNVFLERHVPQPLAASCGLRKYATSSEQRRSPPGPRMALRRGQVWWRGIDSWMRRWKSREMRTTNHCNLERKDANSNVYVCIESPCCSVNATHSLLLQSTVLRYCAVTL